ETMAIEPEVLLRSDVATAEEKDRAEIVKALLGLPDKGRLLHIERNFKETYKKLGHARLAEQLRPYITDQSLDEITKIVAISIIKVCQVRDLQEDLAQIVLDKSQNLDVRVDAASALVYIGNEATKVLLKQLVIE